MIGFACISNGFFGNNNEYMNLISIQVSAEYRKKGIGSVDVAELNQSIAEEEPFDCQLEFVL